MFGLLLPSRPLQCPNCLSRDAAVCHLLADDSQCVHDWHGQYAIEELAKRGVKLGLCRSTGNPCSVKSHWITPATPPPSPTGHTCVGTYKTFSAAHCPYCRASGKPDSLENYSVLSVPE